MAAPHGNWGQDEYIVDLTGHEKQYWFGTDSGLLGVYSLNSKEHVRQEAARAIEQQDPWEQHSATFVH